MRIIIKSLILVLSLSVLVTACKTETVTENAPAVNMVDASKLNVQLGLRYLAQGNTVLAKQKLLLALSQNPSAPAYTAIAYFYENTGDVAQAEKNYQQAISLNTAAGAGHNNYGAFLCRQKQYAQADQQFNLAVSDPNYLNMGGAYENAGLCALLIPDKTKALQYFEKAVQQNPKMTASLEQLVQLNYEQGRYQDANNYLQQYLKVAAPTAELLWIGVESAQKALDFSGVKDYGMLLEKNFPMSKQYQQYLNIREHDHDTTTNQQG
jgi:type IV pilus assembly protein PilF